VQHDLVVMPQERPLDGSVPAPPDEDVGHLALVVAALAEGETELRRLSGGAHVVALVDALRSLGVSIETKSDGVTAVVGRSLRGLADPLKPVFCGGSAPTLRRLSSVLAAHPFRTVLTVDPALPTRGMAAVAAALRRRAAQIEGVFAGGKAGDIAAPFTVGPLAVDHALSGVEYDLSEPRYDVKETLLLSGLYADEATFVRETIVSRDHLERLLLALGVPIDAAGSIAALDPAAWNARIPAFSYDVPGDIAAAAFLSSAASLVPGSRVCVRGVGLNPTRTGLMDLLRQMGGAVETTAQATCLGEAEGIVCASYAPLRSTTMAEELLLRASDDVPALVALAARARGTTEMVGVDDVCAAAVLAGARGFEEAQVVRATGDTSRADAFVDVLRAFGVSAETFEGGLVVQGRPDEPLASADIDARGDAARASLAVLLALVARGTSRIRGVDALAAQFPRIVGTLRALGADVRVEPRD
jgi:3-phosphoshikimate 1-carboxyvinyltransferase